jgi:glycosyltransferase involved in cell wall biosynthesis
MNNLPKISIVTPSYNQGQFLRETIESVLEQDYPNFEYFIVDGGSTDNSVEIIREYEDKIDWWVSEKDEGQSDAINKGFKKATGELLCWVNSDDVLLPNCLQVVADYYMKNNKPDLIHANCLYIDQHGIIIKMIRVPRQTRFFMFRGVWSAPAPAVFFKASLFRNVGYLNPKYHLSMDLDIWMRMMKSGGKVCCIPQYIGAFRQHKNSKTICANLVKKHSVDENHETKIILNAALSGSTEGRRQIWRWIWKLYQVLNLNYLRSFLETKRFKGKHWKEVFYD